MDPDSHPGGPKTYGSEGSGFWSGSATILYTNIQRVSKRGAGDVVVAFVFPIMMGSDADWGLVLYFHSFFRDGSDQRGLNEL
jgi:hypothetical protein